MKNIYFRKTAFIALIGSCIVACKNTDVNPDSRTALDAIGPRGTTEVTHVIPAAGHTFTDVQICYDGKVFLLENGRLKRLEGAQLTDVSVPQGFYTDFSPTYLAISKDFTFYFRSPDAIKIVKGGKLLKSYHVGQAPLQDFTEQTFGSLELAVDEADQSLIFGTVRRGFDPILFSLYKLTKKGQVGFIPLDESDESPQAFMTCFTIGAPGTLWSSGLGAFTEYYYSILYKNSLGSDPFTYASPVAYGYPLNSNHDTALPEGPINKVTIPVIGSIKITKDAKVMYLKTGEYNAAGQAGVSSFGNIYRVRNDSIIKIAQNVENKRIAITNDNKTLYLAGKGLDKITLNGQ
ncbi:MAG: hypothetical protein JKY70_06500 [Mucilaginibacter sp.]|nr:hypothetical protein [Mucilaginibacter sp.]